MSKENIIQTKSYSFALKIIKVYQKYYKNAEVKSLLRQVLNSGTSIGANVEEAEGGQSKRDFIAKLSISYKEARETHYWLRLLRDANVFDEEESNNLLEDCTELIRILTAILNTSKNS
tara:strand:- start:48 stop:401 length:354 start_codon:yes stop_codon:yes gene_type:complete